MRKLVGQAFALLSFSPPTGLEDAKKPKASPRSPVKATTANTELKFIVNFSQAPVWETGRKSTEVKIHHSRYPRQANKCAQKSI